MHDELLPASAKLVPAVSYAGLSLMGIPLADWVTILTLLYIIIQLLLLIPKITVQAKAWRLKWLSRRD